MWAAPLPPCATRALPAGAGVLLGWRTKRLEEASAGPLQPGCPRFLLRVFWADARAEGETVVVGGYRQPHPGTPLSGCPCFSGRLTPAAATRAWAMKGEAYRAIAALELFVPLLCLVLCERAELMEHPNTTVDLARRRRCEDQAADDLTNEEFDKFDPELRGTKKVPDTEGKALPGALGGGGGAVPGDGARPSRPVSGPAGLPRLKKTKCRRGLRGPIPGEQVV